MEHRPNIRAKTTEFLRENTVEILSWVRQNFCMGYKKPKCKKKLIN